ncbi:MAG: hypothetical protein RL288_598 [Actinomycetota bacterium]|jgi:hypothetical protein
MQSAVSNPEKLAVVAMYRDEAKIWRHGIAPKDLPEVIQAPVEVDHRHKRTGQFHHGHDTDHYYPEFYEAVYAVVRESDAVLLIGHGTGKGSSAEKFYTYLEKHHPDFLKRILERLDLNLSAMSDQQLTMNARQWFEKNYRKLATWHDRQSKPWFVG